MHGYTLDFDPLLIALNRVPAAQPDLYLGLERRCSQGPKVFRMNDVDCLKQDWSAHSDMFDPESASLRYLPASNYAVLPINVLITGNRSPLQGFIRNLLNLYIDLESLERHTSRVKHTA